jgi:hypothetical protein
MTAACPDEDMVREATRHWLEQAVIGLNLCPFAKAVHVKGQIHYALSFAIDAPELLDALEREIVQLLALAPEERDTTLLIAPHAMPDFWDFNAFLFLAEKMLRKKGWVADVQIASFHPHYEFADAPPGDMAHYTNRAPYPTLHLLREASLDLAVQSFPDASLIYERNIATMRALGTAGWDALGIGESHAGREAGF